MPGTFLDPGEKATERKKDKREKGRTKQGLTSKSLLSNVSRLKTTKQKHIYNISGSDYKETLSRNIRI